MSKNKTEINPIRAERLKALIKYEGITQAKLGESVYLSQQHISRIITLKTALTEETARQIIDRYPTYDLKWLLGYSDTMTVNDYVKNIYQTSAYYDGAVSNTLQYAVDCVCDREGIEERPSLNGYDYNELVFLKAQLKDYAEFLILNYIKNRKHSHVWQLNDTKPARSPRKPTPPKDKK